MDNQIKVKRSSSTASFLPSSINSPVSSALSPPEDQVEEPPIKKMKTTYQQPIIFGIPGEAVDTSIKVFDQEFQVSSMALKMHTMYFQKFLEPSNGAGNKCLTRRFKYNWYTKIEEDGQWVISSAPEDRDSDHSSFTGDKLREEKAFHNLLRAVFNQQSIISDSLDLCALTSLADFTCCLPVVKNSLFQSMFNNPSLNASIQTKPSELIHWALKLRHPLLFRECLIYLLGPFNSPRYLKLEDKRLVQFAKGVDERFRARVFNVMRDLTEVALDKEMYPNGTGKESKDSLSFEKISREMLVRSTVMSVATQLKKVRYPAYFRKLYSLEYQGDKLHAAVKRILEPILGNNLVLDGSGMQAGEGRYSDYFLGFDIPDEAMPWNADARDW